MTRAELRRIAYREAGALLEADMDASDLQCEDKLSEKDAEYVREFIRTTIVERLLARGEKRR